jgi:hypothetical protein
VSAAVLLDPLRSAGVQCLGLAMYNLPNRYLLQVNHNWVEGTFEKFADQENMRKHFELPRPGRFQGDDLVLTSELLLGLRWVVLFDVSSEDPYWHAGR